MSTLLDRVRDLMEQRGIKAKHLTAELGISNSSFTDWGKGKGAPSLDAVTKFSDYFGVSIDYLVRGKEFNTSVKLDFSNSKDKEFLDKLHSLPPEMRDKVMAYMDGMIAALPAATEDEKRLSI